MHNLEDGHNRKRIIQNGFCIETTKINKKASLRGQKYTSEFEQVLKQSYTLEDGLESVAEICALSLEIHFSFP